MVSLNSTKIDAGSVTFLSTITVSDQVLVTFKLTFPKSRPMLILKEAISKLAYVILVVV